MTSSLGGERREFKGEKSGEKSASNNAIFCGEDDEIEILQMVNVATFT